MSGRQQRPFLGAQNRNAGAQFMKCQVPADRSQPNPSLYGKRPTGAMFNKEDNADVEIGSIMKKVIIGAVFLVALPIVIPALTGVDLANLCVRGEGEDVDEDGCKIQGEDRLALGFDQIKPMIVIGIDLFVIAVGLAVLFGPGMQLIKYQFVPGDATR